MRHRTGLRTGRRPHRIRGCASGSNAGKEVSSLSRTDSLFPSTSSRKRLLEFRPDVIHTADPASLGIAAIYHADVLKLPGMIVSTIPGFRNTCTTIGGSEPLTWKLLRLRHNKAEVNLSTSTPMLEELRSHAIERVHLWPPAVDTEFFHPRFSSLVMCEKLSQGRVEDPLLLCVG
jgi:hypothetical protein